MGTEFAVRARRDITLERPWLENGIPVLQLGWRGFLGLVLFCVREDEFYLGRVIK